MILVVKLFEEPIFAVECDKFKVKKKEVSNELRTIIIYYIDNKQYSITFDTYLSPTIEVKNSCS